MSCVNMWEYMSHPCKEAVLFSLAVRCAHKADFTPSTPHPPIVRMKNYFHYNVDLTMTAAVRSRSWVSRLDEKVERLQFPVKVVNNNFNLI